MRISDRSSDVCSSDLATRCITGAEQLLCNRHRINTGDARRRRLRGKVRGEIVDVFVRQSRSLRLHQRILALAGLEAMQLLARSEEHTSELQSLMSISYAVFCLQKKRPR